jgi:hypothetical protein
MDIEALAGSMKMTLEELAEWAAMQRTVRTLASLRDLAEMQSRLIVSRYRVTAAAKLAALAGQSDDAELARKAAVDLLKLEAGEAVRGKNRSTDEESSSEPIDQAAVLAALERLGNDDDSAKSGRADRGTGADSTA